MENKSRLEQASDILKRCFQENTHYTHPVYDGIYVEKGQGEWKVRGMYGTFMKLDEDNEDLLESLSGFLAMCMAEADVYELAENIWENVGRGEMWESYEIGLQNEGGQPFYLCRTGKRQKYRILWHCEDKLFTHTAESRDDEDWDYVMETTCEQIWGCVRWDDTFSNTLPTIVKENTR